MTEIVCLVRAVRRLLTSVYHLLATTEFVLVRCVGEYVCWPCEEGRGDG